MLCSVVLKDDCGPLTLLPQRCVEKAQGRTLTWEYCPWDAKPWSCTTHMLNTYHGLELCSVKKDAFYSQGCRKPQRMSREGEAGAEQQNALQLFNTDHGNFSIPKPEREPNVSNGEISN